MFRIIFVLLRHGVYCLLFTPRLNKTNQLKIFQFLANNRNYVAVLFRSKIRLIYILRQEMRF